MNLEAAFDELFTLYQLEVWNDKQKELENLRIAQEMLEEIAITISEGW